MAMHNRVMAGRKVVDHFSQVPLAVQLAAILREQIQTGQLAHHDPLPSESTLMQEHEVSRGTARRAVEMLRDEGLVITLAGRATIVK